VDQPLILSNPTASAGGAGSLQLRKNIQSSYSTQKATHLSNGSIGHHKNSSSVGNGLSATQNISRSRKSLSGRSVPISAPVVNQAQKYSQQSSLNNSSAAGTYTGGQQAMLVPKTKAISPGNNFK
jgi:hypothetical protein